jgi:hypothetical protein
VAASEQLIAAVGSLRGAPAADRLCVACVEMLDIDAAAISLVFEGANTGTFGASDPTARVYGEVQFTLGEGPCLDSVTMRRAIAATELAAEPRWPAYTPNMLAHGICSVYALPVVVGGQYVGALDIFRKRPGRLSAAEMSGVLMAAELAQMPLLDLLDADLQSGCTNPDSDMWTELGVLTRSEVNQATGMLVAQLGISPVEALVRLRAHAYATGGSASDTARDILDRRVRLELDG